MQEVTDIYDESIGKGLDLDPLIVQIFDLETFIHDHEDGEDAVVTVLPHPPQPLWILVVRIVEDAQTCEMLLEGGLQEIGSFQKEWFGHGLH